MEVSGNVRMRRCDLRRFSPFRKIAVNDDRIHIVELLGIQRSDLCRLRKNSRIYPEKRYTSHAAVAGGYSENQPEIKQMLL